VAALGISSYPLPDIRAALLGLDHFFLGEILRECEVMSSSHMFVFINLERISQHTLADMLRIIALLLDSKINQKSHDSTEFNKYGVLKNF
jgi:hypothetical protein